MACGSLCGFPFGGVGAGGVWCGTCVSGFLAAPSAHECVCGVCGTGLLFENYIVDASIFYKKQFPRYMNLDLCCCFCVVPFGVRRWGWWCGFCGSLERIAFY